MKLGYVIHRATVKNGEHESHLGSEQELEENKHYHGALHEQRENMS